MDNATRLQYLEAMGIDVWVPRHVPVAVQAQQMAVEIGSSENVGWLDDSMDAEGGPVAEQAETHHDDLDRRRVGHTDAYLVANAETAWKNLQQEVSICRACSLCETRTQTVFGVGSHQANWMLIGEAPGQSEDLQGEPFVGKAGQLLTEMLRAIGLSRDEVYIANILKCRPPDNRDPHAEEVVACHDFLQRQIALLQPKIILAVGRVAAQNLLKTQQSLAKSRGQQYRLENIPLVVVHHPAYLLRTLTEKAKAWDDLQFALSVYQSLE